MEILNRDLSFSYCGHVYHTSCIQKYTQNEKHASCPVCQYPEIKPKKMILEIDGVEQEIKDFSNNDNKSNMENLKKSLEFRSMMRSAISDVNKQINSINNVYQTIFKKQDEFRGNVDSKIQKFTRIHEIGNNKARQLKSAISQCEARSQTVTHRLDEIENEIMMRRKLLEPKSRAALNEQENFIKHQLSIRLDHLYFEKSLLCKELGRLSIRKQRVNETRKEIKKIIAMVKACKDCLQSIKYRGAKIQESLDIMSNDLANHNDVEMIEEEELRSSIINCCFSN